MLEKWEDMTIPELYEEIEKWKREGERRNQAYIEAEKAKQYSASTMAEMNQEIVEVGMVITSIQKYIAERQHGAKNPPPVPKPISHEQIPKHLAAAKAEMEGYHYRRAIDELNIILASHPRHAESLYHRGLAFAELDYYKRAIADFTAVIQIQPNMIEAYWERSRTYGSLEEYDLEIQDLNEVLRLDPNSGQAYLSRGFTFSQIKEYDKALADLNKAVELVPEAEHTFYWRAGVYMELGEYERALEDCQQALVYHPGSPFPQWRINEIQDLISKG